ncbi:unnamed protein product [Rotaria magnacalcarata]|uniref:C2H2-type domain-containing protein n=2 Tax=Rotaria magnacalcarata TaxID=392030 RepID=A0A816LIS7_9BILA|nr:unnamed protein product [Rotaria magnacalcarata]CAF1957033.1 unnamed protein product [Rotaria magnacalcarata]CAF4132691.1 unnamed protein product [Rotaria magnacalcarata]CAF4160670.1 unnamed protein product [Rotaria magnacalcarata]
MSSEYYCKICEITCNGKAPYEQHLKSAKHIKKVKLNESQKPSEQVTSRNTNTASSIVNTPISLTTINNNSEELSFSSTISTIGPETMRILLEWNHPRGYKPYCEICQLQLHGGDNADVHFQSINNMHNEKLAVWKLICEGDGRYSCKVCLEIFSSESLMCEHFQSDQHANSVQQKVYMEKFIKIYEAYNKLKQVRKERKVVATNAVVGDSLENSFKNLNIIDATKSTATKDHPFNMFMLQNAMKKVVNDEN